MKKNRLMALMLTGAMLFSMTACGKDPSELVYLKDFKPDKYVTLGDYTGLPTTIAAPEVTDDDIDTAIMNSGLSDDCKVPVGDRDVVEVGDLANIDFVGTMDGEGVVDMKVGDTKDIALTFPENYYEEIAGKDVVFAVTVNSISTYDREKAREELEQSAQETYNSQVAAELIDTLKQSSTIKDAPSGMVDRMNQTLISNVTAQAGAYGMDAGAFVAAVYGGTADNYEETLRTYSQDVANQYMILAAIAEKENITVTDEEVTEDIRASLGADATDDEVASMMESIDEEAYREYLLTMKVCDFLAENAVTAEE